MTTPFRRISVNVAAWLAGAVASAGVGILALSQIDDGFGGAGVQPMNPDTVITVAAGEPSPDPTGTPSGTTRHGAKRTDPSPARSEPTPAPSRTAAEGGDGGIPHADGGGTERVLATPGGSLVARCGAGLAYLASWSPAQGYRADDVRRGPAAETSLIFEGTQSHAVTIRCVAGVPQASIRQQPTEGGEDPHDGK